MYNRQNHREVAQSYERSYTNWYNEGIVQFRPNFDHNQEPNLLSDDHNSGEASPPLWKNSPSHPLLGRHNHRRSLSPDSRTEAIARGQYELMEMVKNMPESSYELSLKDLVENNRVQNIPAPGMEELRVLESKNQSLHQRVKVKRQESFENRGVVLNMVFPFSLKSKKKRNFDSNSSGKVSPRPEMGLKGGGIGGGGGGERDWWKKKFTGSSDSDSSRISGSSGGGGSSGSSGSSGGGSNGSGRSHGGGRKRDGLKRGCCVFFQCRKGKKSAE